MKNWFNKFFKSEEQEEFKTPKNAAAGFVLKYQNLTVGYLNYSDGKWVFQYSDDFKNQDRIDVLIDFPKKDQKYEGETLWPFFSHRIPGLGQPQIREIIEMEKLNSQNEIDLLRRFGMKSITNPFTLLPAA